eukprot:9326204-Alexandrium_andersonii.AAC.1
MPSPSGPRHSKQRTVRSMRLHLAPTRLHSSAASPRGSERPSARPLAPKRMLFGPKASWNRA